MSLASSTASLGTPRGGLATSTAEYGPALLSTAIDEWSEKFAELGIGIGSRVMFHGSRAPGLVVAILAALRGGAVLSTANLAVSNERLRDQIRRVGAQLLVSEVPPDAPDTGQSLAGTSIVAIDPNDVAPGLTVHVYDPAGFRPDHHGPVLPNGTRIVFFTSGTTSGSSKGVCVSDDAVLAACRTVAELFSIDTNDRVLATSAATYDFGFYSILAPLMVGATAIAGDVEDADDSTGLSLARSIDEVGATALHAFPPTLARLSRALDQRPMDSSALRYICTSGQRMPTTLAANLVRQLPTTQLFLNYGMTESKRISCHAVQASGRYDSVGKPAPGVNIALLDSAGNWFDKGPAAGELAVASPMNMIGYLGGVPPSHTVFRPDDNRPWLLTGDQFEIDEAGYLYFRGRADDTVSRDGLKVNLKHVETILESIPGVFSAFVTSRPDQHGGHIPIALLQADPGQAQPLDLEYVRLQARLRLEAHEVPAELSVVATMPTGPTGKTTAPSTRSEHLPEETNKE